ncbi:putative ATP-dependent RNA helicase DDX20 [Toxocara canis]|uniref:Putative ATP-dependent RNA helicase DDX20 n=1 Tax=Toxocara canis TaxID=6265 RepID=A0A0B2VTK4_TOXCA|nr:putative ATP-dependent RNA helicase DDX20 [Toxocara canis]
MLTRSSVDALGKAGFISPSPVQAAAIPVGLMGFDMLVQAKSGTGKTLVFALMALEGLNAQLRKPQVMILAPTREIAIQITATLRRLAPPVVHVGVFVGGGRSVGEDVKVIRKGVHIVVGTTGRVCQLVNEDILPTTHVRLFVLDEADKLMEEDFQKDINFLFSSLPDSKQVAVFSATYPGDLDETLARYMIKAHLIRLSAEDVQLLGIKQYVALNYSDDGPTSLIHLLSSITFNQCLVFANFQDRCEQLVAGLKSAGMDAELISGSMEQVDRNRIIKRLKNFQLKVLVSTDLTARGIDAENVNVVVNVGCPMSSETYLHRIGRAGRFGGYGASVTILSMGKDVKRFIELVKTGNLRVKLLHLTEDIPRDLCQNQSFYDCSSDFKPAHKKRTQETRIADEIEDSSKSLRGADMSPSNSHSVNISEEEVNGGGENLTLSKQHTDNEEHNDFGGLPGEMLQMIRHLEISRRCKAESAKEESLESLDTLKPTSNDCLDRASKDSKPNGVVALLSGSSMDRADCKGDAALATDKGEVGVNETKDTKLAEFDHHSNTDKAATNESDAKLAAVAKPVIGSEVADHLSESVNERKSKFKRLTVRTRRRVFLRGEILRLREVLSASQWWDYACLKYASVIDNEPFIKKHFGEEALAVSTTTTQSLNGGVNSRSKSVDRVDKVSYSRETLIAIREGRCAQEWSMWAMQKWDTKDEPFQMDSELRVPLSKQIRVVREREKRARDAVKAERLAAEAAEAVRRSNLVFSSSRFPVHVDLPGTFEEYAANFYERVRQFEEKKTDGKRLGPVITALRGPKEYEETVSEASAYLESLKSSFWAQLRYSMGSINDQFTSADEPQIAKLDAAVQTVVPIEEEAEKEEWQREYMHKVDGSTYKREDVIEETYPYQEDERERNEQKLYTKPSQLLNNYYYYLGYYTNKYFAQKTN